LGGIRHKIEKAKAAAMYAPELKGNSDEVKIAIGD
jgi:hypothetical protein